MIRKDLILGIILVILIFTVAISGCTNEVYSKHFENQYVSFDYPSNWNVNDLSDKNMTISGSNNSQLSLSLIGPHGETGSLNKSTIESMRSNNYSYQKRNVNGYIINKYEYRALKMNYGAYIQVNDKVYDLRFIAPSAGVPTTESIKFTYIVIINSIKFK